MPKKRRQARPAYPYLQRHVVETDLRSPGIGAALATPIAAQRLTYSRGRDTWSGSQDPFGDLMLDMLARDDRYDGESEVVSFVELVSEHSIGTDPFARGRPTSKNVASITAAGLIINGGPDLDTLVDSVRRLDRAAAVYTVADHGATETNMQWPSNAGELTDGSVARFAAEYGICHVEAYDFHDDPQYGTMVTIYHPATNRCEALFPLDPSYQMEPSSGSAQANRAQGWADFVNGIAELLGVRADARSFAVDARLQGPTRWIHRGVGSLAIIPGRRLCPDEVPAVPFSRSNLYAVTGTGVRGRLIDPSRPILLDSFDLIPWDDGYGHRFRPVRCFHELTWDFSPQSERPECDCGTIRCPNSGRGGIPEHTCVVRDSDGERRPFELYCEHPSCSGLGKLEILALLEQVAVVPWQYFSFSDLLCQYTFYHPDPAAGQFGCLPRRGSYLLRPMF